MLVTYGAKSHFNPEIYENYSMQFKINVKTHKQLFPNFSMKYLLHFNKANYYLNIT